MAASDKLYRPQKTLDIVFAVSCVLMLVSIFWMLAVDYSRPYKRVQRGCRDVETARTERQMLDKLPDETKISEIREAQDAYNAAKAKVNQNYQSVKGQLEKALGEKANAENYRQACKADLDSVTSLYNID